LSVSSQTSPGLKDVAPVGAVVLHADDFGMNRHVTEGIVRGFSHGLLTSTSLLANAPDAHRALGEWRRLEQQRTVGRLGSGEARARLGEEIAPFDLGIHLNLTQGRPLSPQFPAELLDSAGMFSGIGPLFRHLRRRQHRFEPALGRELAAQIEFMLDRGFAPTHLNGHQYVEMLPGLYGTIRALLARYGIRVGAVAPGFTHTDILAAMRPEVLDKLTAPVPLKRLGKPEEIAHAVQFIFENDFFTGRCLELDGGLRL